MIAAAEKIRLWREKPTQFVREVLLAEPDAWQDEVLNAACTHQRICLKASKGPGKSTILAWLGWWFLLTRLHPKVVATSVTAANLHDNLWTEMSKWQQKSRLLRALFEWTDDRIFAKQHRETWWASARSWPKTGDATRQADTLAGIHADNVMFLLDEAGGIPDAVAATAEAGLANENSEKGREALLIIAGNPTNLDGPLYRACTRERGMWWVKEISGDPDDPKRAPRVSVKWAREQISKYGRDNPWVLVNVFGQFPPGQSNALIGVEMATAAGMREHNPRLFQDEPKILGVDIARFGDDRSVIFMRQGLQTFRPSVFRNVDTMDLADRIATCIYKNKPDGVFLDMASFGAGVYDRLKQLGHNVSGVDFGGKPLSPKFANRRAEMWHGMAEWLKRGAIPDDNELISELTAPTYKFDEHGKLLLEKKADIKKRISVSPDKADALALTFAAPVADKSMRAYQDRLQRRRKRRHDTYDPLANFNRKD